MTTLPTGVQIYFVTAFFVAASAHFLLKQYLVASSISALLSPLAFALVCFLHGETVHLVEVKLFVFFAVIGLLVAALVGLPFLLWRRNNGA